ncbi:septation protein IspZ [Acuticoccus sp. MNP-M23]|uniref:inner membrane-spanning protein YciB n=1 Tax=Acuticoccus sp. MNP-M23 TaxID=3072793 RepID=UPI002814AE81|nr:septation protein IspZ [Acuticoccus sp. MNP-M23]WMS42444.1 septation protein IspZ [Acuticoccus sp. MNP-M23]
MTTVEQKPKTAWEQINKRKLFERFAIEIGPALAFVIALQILGLNQATLFFIVATLGTALYSWFEKRHFPYIPFGMVVLAAVFGAATIAFDNAAWIEFRATLVNAGGAVALLVGLLMGKLVLKNSLQDGFRLTDGAWWVLTLRMIIFLSIMAAANEFMRLTFSTETWAIFKTVTPVFNLVFLALSWRTIRDNLSGEHGVQLTETPPVGPKTALHPAH